MNNWPPKTLAGTTPALTPLHSNTWTGFNGQLLYPRYLWLGLGWVELPHLETLAHCWSGRTTQRPSDSDSDSVTGESSYGSDSSPRS
jgi:hypothetical protein